MMRLVLASPLATLASTATPQSPTKVALANAQGQPVGTGTITARAGGGVQIALDVKGLPPMKSDPAGNAGAASPAASSPTSGAPP